MIIKNWPIERVKPYDKNPRINDGAVDAVAASLAEFGWRQPIVVDADGVIIVGHTRWKAAQKLGMKKVPVHVATDMTEAQVKAYRLADNQTATLAEWDYKLLPIEIADLQGMGFDLPVLGFSDEALAGIMGTASDGLTDADATPEPPTDPVSKTGDLWLMGEHRLLCGDSTDADIVSGLMSGEKAHLCLTDPPYGVGFDYESHDDTKQNLSALIAGFFPLAEQACDRILLTPGNENQRLYPQPDWTLCWFVAAGTGRNRWGFTCWQPILAYGKDPYLAAGKGSRPDAFEMCEAAPKDTGHSCPKPVGVWCKILERGSAEQGERVYDPFSGSGTTIIACEQLGRKCYAVEIEPRYVDVAVIRWQNFTGKQATLEATGETFEERSNA